MSAGERMREIISANRSGHPRLHGQGWVYKLSCGHETYHADNDILGIGVLIRCHEGPCYQFDKAMGKDC